MIYADDVINQVADRFRKELSEDANPSAFMDRLLVITFVELLNREHESIDARLRQLEAKLSIDTDL